MLRWLGEASAHPAATWGALATVAVWLASGYWLGWGSELWMAVIGTWTAVVTYLMTFLLQASQDRDTKAVQAKLDELIKATAGASNRLIGAEEHPGELDRPPGR